MRGSLLPLEIVASILSRLPVKALARFRCVSKEWRTLTYNPNFIEEHHACARAPGRLAIIPTRYLSPKMLLYDFGDNGEVRNRAFNMRFGDRNGYSTSNPVDGLICCREYCNEIGYDEGNHYLLNPATGELAKLPTSASGQRDIWATLGLGFDSSTGGYKLVKFFHTEGTLKHCGCKVLEVGTREWREVGRAPCLVPNYSKVPVYLNGALHWISWWYPTVNRGERTVVAFNLKDENFRLIPFPPECGGQVYIVEWEGQLSLVKLPMTGYARRSLLIIWRLEDHATCRWSEAHCSKMSNYKDGDGLLIVIGIRNNEILLVLKRVGGLGSICSYDLCSTGNLRRLYPECPGGLQFLTESLVSPRYLAGDLSLR